jgi:hypothetical protein
MAHIGNIPVPEVSPSGEFPFVTDYPHELRREYTIVAHLMANTLANLKIEQRFLLGTGVRVFTFRQAEMHIDDLDTLLAFWQARQGSYQPFTYNAPSDDGQSTEAVTVRFAGDISYRAVTDALFAVECLLIETPSTGPTYTLNSTDTRFPSETLTDALLEQEQELIPLVHVQVLEAGYPDNIYLSNRLCTVGAQDYLPRLLSWGPISQAIGGESDQATFVFGNADRVMRDLAADTNLDGAVIEFSLFHVGTGIKLDIWRGYVVDFGGDAEDEFELIAQDGIPLEIMHPMRSVSRTCWKPFNDGVNCIPPESSGVPCDHTLEGEFGCRFHNNARQFGGHITKPQSVRVKDNSTGTWGIGRLLLNATSLVNDSVDGAPLPEIYTDVPIPVQCLVAAARDEGDFYDVLGIVGEGPLSISQDIYQHRVNGQPPHGTQDQVLAGLIYGFRSSSGPDPEALQASGVFPADSDHWFQLTESGGDPDEATAIFAAGTAFAEIRIVDEKGLQLRRAQENEMQVVVDLGLGGYYWDGGRQTAEAGITNPIWVAVNTYLRALRLKNASAETQEALFDVDAAVAAAAVCADVVDKLVGVGSSGSWGTETQFKYVGILRDRKPLRDWLADILQTCLGYYTWVWGKLYLGMRIHSGVEADKAFTTGNVIHDSLRIRRKVARFNHLTVEFDEPNPDENVDRALDFARTTIVVEDQDHIETYGLKPQSVALNGVVSRSQALRVGATLLREELGGVSETEWRAARVGVFRSTVLSIGIIAGDVCSLTHPDMPDGMLASAATPDYGEFRVKRWRLHPDFSLEIEWETTTDSMYDLVVGPKPTDIPPDPLPVERIEEILPLQPWFPDQEAPAATDPLWDESDVNFRVQQVGTNAADGTVVRLSIFGDHPTTRTIPDTEPPRIGSISTSSTGGQLAAGAYIVVCLSAVNGSGEETRVSKPMGVQCGVSTSTNKIVLSNITWPEGTVGYRLYASADPRIMCRQDEATSTQPTSLDVTSVANIRRQGVPQEHLLGLKARAKHCYHAGVVGLAITDVVTGAGIVVADAGWEADEWQGRYVIMLADESDGSAPPLVFQILSNTEDTLVCDPDPGGAGVQEGDPFTITTKATTFSATQIGDEKFQNSQYPAGMNTDEEIGRVVRIIRGTGAGQERLVVGNDQTVLDVAPAWDTEPDATSIFIVIAAAWEYESSIVKLSTLMQAESVEISLPVENLLRETLICEVATVNKWGKEPNPSVNPWRLIYLFGVLGAGVRDWTAVIQDLDPTGAQAPLEAGDDLFTHRPVDTPEGYELELLEWVATLKVAPATGGTVELDILFSEDDGETWASIFPSGERPTFQAGEKLVAGSVFAQTIFPRHGIFSCDIVTVDGTAADLNFVLSGRKVPMAA